MKRLLLSLTLVWGLCVAALAIQPIHKPFAVKNSDGTTVQLYKHGDGYLAFYTTLDDRVVVRDSEGTLCYAEVSGSRLVASSVRVHDLAQRSAAEQAYMALSPREVPATAVSPRRAPRRVHTAYGDNGLGEYGHSANGAVPTIGDLEIPVIMVAFSDKAFAPTTTVALMDRFYNEEGFDGAGITPYTTTGSVRDYFITQSRGLFRPHFDVVGMVTLPKSYAYYGKNGNDGHDANAWQMVSDAVAAAKAQGVDFSKYNYTSGKVPLVSIFYAGQGEATGDDENTIWPHECDLGSSSGSMSGYKFGSYFVGNELFVGYTTYLAGMGIFVHEFSHALGLPDFYATDYSYSNNDSFGKWSVMDHGAYNDDTYNPTCYTAYERNFMGWLDLPVLSDPQGVTLSNPHDGEGTFAVCVPNPSSSVETFILENRQPGKWTPTGGGSGLMITRIKYYENAWYLNEVNNAESKKRAMMVTANGAKINDSASPAHLYGNGVAECLSLPLYAGTELTSAPLYQIIKHSNGTLSFSYRQRDLYTETADNGQYFALVSSTDELHAGDSVVVVCPDEAMTIATQAASGYRPATTVKLADGIAYGNDDALVFKMLATADGSKWGFSFRSSNKNYYLSAGSGGTLTTATKADAKSMATIDITDGKATITFGGTYASNTLGYVSTNSCFRCLAPTEDSRVSLYRKVDDLTPVRSIALDHEGPQSTAIYTLGGQYVGRDLRDLPRGIYIRNGHKVVR